MADITRLARFLNGAVRGLDLTSNTPVVLSIKIGGVSNTELTKAILDRLISLQNGSDVDATYHTHDGRYFTETELGSNANGLGASLIGIEDAATQFTSTNVEGALAEAIDAAQAAQADIDAHEDGAASKHDATEIDYERADGSKKDIQAASDDVESALTDLDDNKISKTGSIAFTGDQSMGSFNLTTLAYALAANPSHAVRRDQIVGRDDGSSDFSASSKKISSLADPTTAQDAATKAYVDSLLDGRSWKQSVRVASTANIDLGVAADPSPVDGITLANGDRILLKNQTATEENGIYDAVDATDPTTWVRSSDANTALELEGAALFVEEGTANADSQWAQTSDNFTLDTDPVVWVLTSANNFSGHDMISLSGGQISVDLATVSGLESSNPGNAAGQLRIKLEASNPSLQIDGSNQLGAKLDAARAITTGASGIGVNVDNSSIEIATNALQVKDLGISTAKIAADAVTGAKIRLDNAEWLRARNAADSADVNMFRVNSSDELEAGVLLNAELAYTPNTLSDWNSSSDPGNTDDALDQLASRVTTLEAEPTDAIQEVFPAGEAYAATTLFAVRMAKAADAGFVAGRVYKADTDASSVDNFYSIGLVYDASGVTAGNNITVTKFGKMTVTAHGFTVGAPIFLDASGAVTETPTSTVNEAVVYLGVARDANTLEINPQVRYVN